MKKTIILFILFLCLAFLPFLNASAVELSGYIYSENAGWISLNCENTGSCKNIDYKVSADGAGKISGYAFSQNGWINFSPDYGGITADDLGNISGWAWSEKLGWVNFSNAKLVSKDDFNSSILSAENAVNMANTSTDNSSASIMGAIKSFCNKIYGESGCQFGQN
jgi:hypothetical protein